MGLKMKLNKIFLIPFCFVLLSTFAFAGQNTVNPPVDNTSSAVVDDSKSGIDEKTQTILDKIGFGKFVDSNSTKEIESFFKTFEKYTAKGDIEKLKTLYSDDFINNDGFDKKTYFDLITLVSDMYEDAEYKMDITSVHRDGDYAYAYLNEVASAKTTDKYNENTGIGVVKSDSVYLFHLQKISGKWKIRALDVLSEQTSLVYGDARDLDFEIKAPTKVKQGTDYTIDFSINNMPNDAVLIASITNDPIIYPQVNREEVFRTLKKNKNLERIVRANSDNYNEYATVSLGVTKAGVIKNGEEIDMVKIYMTGMAFVMSRVNVEQVINHKVEQKSDGKVKNGTSSK